jgi:N utilization substance protein B
MSNPRRRARRLAFQALFMLDARQEWDLQMARTFLTRQEPPLEDEALDFSVRLLARVLSDREQIDERLDRAHPRWKLARLHAEDRNILRLGMAELLIGEVPPKVVLNEWIEEAKAFGSEESPRFINGILDRIWKEQRGDADVAG